MKFNITDKGEASLRAVLDAVHVGILVIDSRSHEIVEANDFALGLIGGRKDQVTGRICHGFVCPAETGKCPVTDLGRNMDLSERELIDTTGRQIPILKSAAPIMWGGRPCLIESFIDITVPKRAESALKESEAKFRSILEGMGEGVVVVDRDYRITLANRGYCSQVRMTAEEMAGRHCFEISHRSSRPCFETGEECSVKMTFETGSSHKVMHTHKDKDNRAVYVEVISYPLKDPDGKVVSAIEVLTDITGRVTLEDDLRGKVKELEEFYDMAVGRELRMVELKEELQKLKEELGRYKKR